MDPTDGQPAPPDPASVPTEESTRSSSGRVRRRRRRSRKDKAPGLYTLCDRAIGTLLLFLVVFTPWAFGTTQTWSLLTAHACGTTLLALVALKALVAWQTGHGRSDEDESPGSSSGSSSAPAPLRWWGPAEILLALLTAGILAYVAISALNARADYDEARREFVYLREPIQWLPHSYDRGVTWETFFQYLGLAGVFWAARDWLRPQPGSRSDRDEDRGTGGAPGSSGSGSWVIPERARWLLWVLCLNGAALAVVCVLQRASGTNRLLWILESRSNKAADAVFGPWSYRANAAQYLNLLWPVCLGFWLWAQMEAAGAADRLRRRIDGPQLLLLPCTIAMAAGPFISGSRGGALVSILLGIAAVVLILVASGRQLEAGIRRLTLGALLVAGGVALVGGWDTIWDRVRRSDGRFPSDLAIGTGDFSMVTRVRLPEAATGQWQILAGMVQGEGNPPLPNRAYLHVSPEGALIGHIYGSATTNRYTVTVTNLPAEARAGRAVTLALVRQRGLRLYLDGEDLAGTESRLGRAPGWDAHILSSFLLAGVGPVTEVAATDIALTPEELRAIAQQPLTNLVAQLASTAARPVAVGLATNEVVLPYGTAAETTSRNTEASVRWLTVRRTEGPGHLGFRRPLGPLGSQMRGRPQVSFVAWNPTDETVALDVSIDGGPASRAELAPRSEKTVRLPVSITHGGAPGFIEFAVGDADGLPADSLPPGEQIFVRDLHLSSSVQVLTKSLNPGFSLNSASLTDRMSGRPEIYGNARRMAADYPVWGSGAGTFASLYQLYRPPGQVWAAYAHDDWLETRITLGMVGFVMVVAALAVLAIRSWKGCGMPAPRLMVALGWLALGGCLAHARFDYPFQIHSVVLLFVTVGALLSSLVAARRG